MRSVPSSGDVEVALHEHGGSGRPTLLCHATGFHGAVWEPLADALGDEHERWAIDFRGHGAARGPAELDLSWDAVADDVLAVVDAIGAPAGLLGVGHSMGGACLLLAEQARPGTFAGLWLFEPITPPPGALSSAAGGNALADGASRRRASFPSAADALANFAAKPPLRALRADALHAYVRHGFVPADDGSVDLACRPEVEAQIYRGGGAHGAFARLGEVRCPVVVACGGDAVGPAQFVPAVVEALPHATLERHPHLGHFGPLEAPGELAASVAAFARSL
jgi:pimeloyl-ACP methyl ester carboxylesterase